MFTFAVTYVTNSLITQNTLPTPGDKALVEALFLSPNVFWNFALIEHISGHHIKFKVGFRRETNIER